MNIKYRILETHPEEHSISVRYYTDIVTEDYLAVSKTEDGTIIRTKEGYPEVCRTDYNLNIFDPSMSEKDLLLYIQRSAPKEWLSMHELIINPEIDTSLKVLDKIKKVEHSFDPEKLPISNPVILS